MPANPLKGAVKGPLKGAVDAVSGRPSGRPDGRQGRWDQHNLERREVILEAAVAVIEENEPGAEIHVQQIAERAGLSRSVVYRHFTDRADLDAAVQAEILESLWADLLPGVTLDGTIPQIIERIVSTYVGWAVAHPALHTLVENDTLSGNGSGAGPLQQGIERIAEQVVLLIVTAVDALHLEVTDEERAAVDPLVFGLVGAVFGAVRRWMSKPERTPSAPVLIELTTQSVWHILRGHGEMLGLELLADQPIEELLATAQVPEAAGTGT